jgi:F0F1-type ATP synthase assembly protein I
MQTGGSRDSENKSSEGSWTSVLALVAQMGFSIAIPMVVFIGGGAWLDNQFGTTPWLLIIGILLGVATAGSLFYQIATLPTRKRAPKADTDPNVPYKVERTSKPKGVDRPRSDKPRSNGH